MQVLKVLMESPALNVFLGTLPLLLTIAWGLLSNNKRLDSIENRISTIENRVTRIDGKLDSIDGNLSSIRERLAKVEARLEGSGLVLAR